MRRSTTPETDIGNHSGEVSAEHVGEEIFAENG